jgi:hypothetical protein
MIGRALAVLAAAAWLALHAPPPAAAAAPTVTGVALESPQELPRGKLAAIGALAGQPLSRRAVRESLDRLWALGIFDAIAEEEHPDGPGVKLVYQVRRRPWLASLAWTGDLGLDRADIAAATDLSPQGDAGDATIAAHGKHLAAWREHRRRAEPEIPGPRHERALRCSHHCRSPAVGSRASLALNVSPGRSGPSVEGDRYRARGDDQAEGHDLPQTRGFPTSVTAVSAPWDPASNRVTSSCAEGEYR